jgi:hypothetical protein
MLLVLQRLPRSLHDSFQLLSINKGLEHSLAVAVLNPSFRLLTDTATVDLLMSDLSVAWFRVLEFEASSVCAVDTA